VSQPRVPVHSDMACGRCPFWELTHGGGRVHGHEAQAVAVGVHGAVERVRGPVGLDACPRIPRKARASVRGLQATTKSDQTRLRSGRSTRATWADLGRGRMTGGGRPPSSARRPCATSSNQAPGWPRPSTAIHRDTSSALVMTHRRRATDTPSATTIHGHPEPSPRPTLPQAPQSARQPSPVGSITE
jgi:hypothetical protein